NELDSICSPGSFRSGMTHLGELLESRQLLSSVSVIAGVLTVNADSSSDMINVDPASGGMINVTLNGATSSFAAASFNSILINANGGNDKVIIGPNVTKPATIKGGAGNDSLVGGGGNDLIDGGAGGDTIRG